MSRVASSMSTSRFRSWPITEAAALEPSLREMGLRVPTLEIDGTTAGTGKCLSDALVSVGPAGRGGTGSFISGDGLIVTNHHVALDAVRRASTSEADYLNDGFVARGRADEISDADYEVWITRSCVDVSDQLVESRQETDPLKRANKVRDRRQEIAREAEAEAAAASSVRCEVQEMWPDRTYVLFTYERLRDVRLVYVPPMSLGCFGGDTDNFEWPRHTADFTLLRAYVAPDGSAAEYAAENVPYKPATHIQVSTKGASDGDFVFLLGFPYAVQTSNPRRADPVLAGLVLTRASLALDRGNTMRYAPACRLAYSDEVAVPALVHDFGEKLGLIATHATDRAAALKMATARKGLANEYKRSVRAHACTRVHMHAREHAHAHTPHRHDTTPPHRRIATPPHCRIAVPTCLQVGKRVMMRKLRLQQEREAEEKALCAAAPAAAPLLAQLATVYERLRATSEISAALDQMQGIYHGSSLLAVGHAVHEAALEAAKPDAERETAYRERNLPFMIKRLTKRLVDLHPPHESALIRRAAAVASKLPLGLLPADTDALEQLATALEAAPHDSRGAWPSLAALSAGELELALKGTNGAEGLKGDAAVGAAAALYLAYVADRDASKALLSERDQLVAALLEIQREVATTEDFYPDANGCLRLSAGHVEGYSAADAVVHTPATTLAGLVDKHLEATISGDGAVDAVQGKGEFDCPTRLAELCAADPAAAATPVCLLYSTDTVGGNSGSPVLDADGNFVAINFDRQRLGLMNEFKWSREYSRSIGTDVRYMLLLIGKYDGAQWLVDEMVGGASK